MELNPQEKLKISRMRKGYTQEKLALLLHCSQMEVSRIERGTKEPSPVIRERIEQVLGEQIWDNESVESNE